MGNERDQDSWLGATLRRTSASAPDTCLDAETLAAWSDGGLNAKAAAAVELHASNCSRCTAVLTELARSTPVASATHAWTPVRMFRWLAPLAAAATAIAIWIAVPDRPIAPIEPARAVHDLTAPEPGTLNPEPGTQRTELRTPNQNPAPSTPNLEPRGQSAPGAGVDMPAAEEVMRLREELKRESAPAQAMGRAARVPPPAAPAPAPAADALAATAATMERRSAFVSVGMSAESVSPSNELIRWRIAAPTSIERSADGGKTWTKTTSPASTVAGVRAVDGERAVARTSDGAEFYTTDGGLSWTRVQENIAAPF